MYKTILVTLDTKGTDRAIIDHVKILAAQCKSAVVLLHVATGVPAQVLGSSAGGKEIEEDEAYLEAVKSEFNLVSVPTTTQLSFGDPVKEIVKWLDKNPVDLVAMSTHGHKAIGDLIHGSTASRVQHRTNIPVLLLRAK